MSKRNKRARTLINKMNILDQIPDIETAKRYGIEKQVNARIRVEEENSLRIQKLKEAQKAAEAKKEAELKAKKEAEPKVKKATTPKTKTRRTRTSKTK